MRSIIKSVSDVSSYLRSGSTHVKEEKKMIDVVCPNCSSELELDHHDLWAKNYHWECCYCQKIWWGKDPDLRHERYIL